MTLRVLRKHDSTHASRTIVGFTAAGRPVFRIAGGSPDGDGDGGAGGSGGDGGSGAGDGTDNSGGDGDGDGGSGGDTKNDDMTPREKALAEEKERQFRRRQEAETKAADLEKRLKEIEDKDKSEVERATGKVQELETENTTLKEALKQSNLRLAFVSSNKYTWHDPEDALRLTDLSDITWDDKTGEPDKKALEKALDDLAKSKPHLVKKADDGDGAGSGPSGAPANGKRKGEGDELSREALMKKYPALRR